MTAKIFYRNGNISVYSGAVAFNRDDRKKIFTITLEKTRKRGMKHAGSN